MSFGDLEYQETTSNSLARMLKGMRQEQIILDAVQNPIDDVEEYPDARQVESVKGTKDDLGAVIIPVSKTWQLPAEPNENTALMLWFREGWRIKDHSCRGNQAFATQIEPSPFPVQNYVPLRRKVSDDQVTDGRFYGIIDGVSQYYRVTDAPTNRITDLLVTKDDICFSIFLSPWEKYVFDTNNRMTLFQHLEDDQMYNAIKVQVTEDGAIEWNLNWHGDSYHVATANETVPITELPEFLAGEFLDDEFITHSSKEWQYNPDINPPDWTWLFFTFNKNSRVLSIMKVAAGFAATELVASSDETGFRTNMSLFIPGNEGGTDATTAYDITGNARHAVFANSPNAPSFIDGVLHFGSNTARALIANHASINTLSVFTIALKVRLHAYAATAEGDYLITKGVSGNGEGATGAGDFKIYMAPSASKTLRVRFQADSGGVTQTIDVPNAIPALNQWANVIITYNGTTWSVEVDNITPVTLAAASNVLTNSESWYMGDTVSAVQGDIVDFTIVKGEVWSSTKKTWFKNRVPGFKAGFPDWKPPKPPEPETPVPIVRPMEKIYELTVPDSTDTQKVNALQATTPYDPEYDVPGGVSSTTAEEEKYSVADGTAGGGSTSPVNTVYNLAGSSSWGDIQNNERAYIQRIDSSDSDLFGENPTDLAFVVRRSGTCDGQVYPCIFRSDGSYTRFGAGKAASGLSTSSESLTGTDFVAHTPLAVGDGVGVVWEGNNSGTVQVQRGGSGIHTDVDGDDLPLSWQNIHTGSAWGSDNDDFSIAGTVKTGGITTPGTNPFAKMGTTNRRFAHYQINSTIENIKPSKVKFRARRLGSAASATLICTIRNSSTILYQFPQTISFNSISTSVQDIEFVDVDNVLQWADGYRISLEYANITGINDTTNCLEVNFNIGSGAGVFGGTAVKAQYYRATGSVGWYDYSPVADWAGKIYIGGNTFTPYVELNNVTKIVAEKVNQSTSPNISKLFNKKHSKWIVTLKKAGSPTGEIRIRVYAAGGTGHTAIYDFDTILDASSLTTSDVNYVFTRLNAPYSMAQGDRIGVYYNDGNATDKVLVKINTDTAAGAPADGTKSIMSTSNGTTWTDDTAKDVAGQIYSGGIADLVSRNRVAIRCDSIFSQLMSDKITKVQIKLKKLGSPTGTYFLRTVRGSDSSNRDLLGSGDIAALSTSVWTTIDVSNFNALHYMGESDKFVIDYNGGDPNNCLLVQIKKSSTYDDEDTQYEEWNGVEWLKSHPDWDIACTLWKGGDTYTPDAGTPYVEPPDFYDHDLIIGAGIIANGATPDSFYGMRVRDFRIETEVCTLEQIDTIFANKYSKRGGAGEVALVGWFTHNGELEPPE